MGTPWPRPLGRRECVAWTGVVGAGDCERGEDELGGPLDQADFDGSWVGFFGADADEGLLILREDDKIH
jgi:hypothetical protein